MAERPGGEPVEPHLVETLVEPGALARGSFLDVRRDTVALPNGATTTREYIVHPGAVAIVPLLDDGRLVLVRQYRYPLQCVLLEFPAGKIDPGEAPVVTAVRELAEETGWRAGEVARAGVLHNAAAYSTEGIELWFARGLVAGAQALDAGEFIEVRTCTGDELDALAARGELTDAKTLIGLMWLRQWRAGRWPLQWQPAPIIAP